MLCCAGMFWRLFLEVGGGENKGKLLLLLLFAADRVCSDVMLLLEAKLGDDVGTLLLFEFFCSVIGFCPSQKAHMIT